MRRLILFVAIVLAAAIALPPLWYTIFAEPIPELPPAGRRVSVAQGVAVNVIEEGTGRPIVLVHGHPATAYDWTPLMHELAQRGYHALAYDRVGYGRSDGRPNDDFTVDANANELLALIGSEDLHDVVVVGWSYGGGVAIAAAGKDDSRVDRLVLVGSVGPGIENRDQPPALVAFMAGPGLSWLSHVPPLARRVRAALTADAFHPDPITPGYLEQQDANFGSPHTLQTFRSEGHDLGGDAKIDPSALDLPILIVQGESDLLVPLEVGRELYRRAPHSDLWIVPKGGHMLPITHTRELADAIDTFVHAKE